jgi:hypothetical protein
MANVKKSKPGAVKRESNKNEDALRDIIARKAYEIYVANGREDGKDFEHWLEAEMIIMAEKKKAK